MYVCARARVCVCVREQSQRASLRSVSCQWDHLTKMAWWSVRWEISRILSKYISHTEHMLSINRASCIKYKYVCTCVCVCVCVCVKKRVREKERERKRERERERERDVRLVREIDMWTLVNWIIYKSMYLSMSARERERERERERDIKAIPSKSLLTMQLFLFCFFTVDTYLLTSSLQLIRICFTRD